MLRLLLHSSNLLPSRFGYLVMSVLGPYLDLLLQQHQPVWGGLGEGRDYYDYHTTNRMNNNTTVHS